MASFWDMAGASKVLVLILLIGLPFRAAHAQASGAVGLAAEVAELQFELARALALAGDHEAAAREFDRALTLQRNVNQATPEQTEAALQTLRAYVQSRPELPRIQELERRLRAADRVASQSSQMVPNAPVGRGQTPPAAMPGITPNAPPGAPAANASNSAVAPNPYRPPRPAWEQARARRAAAPPPPQAPANPELDSFQLRASPRRVRRNGEWWEQVTISADELLVPMEWVAALNGIRGNGTWPRPTMIWSELLVPDGWDRPSEGLASMLLVEAELLVPPGW